MESAAANRAYDALHEDRPFHDGTHTMWAKEASPDTPYHARDGVTVWVTPADLSPDDTFLTDPNAPGTSSKPDQ